MGTSHRLPMVFSNSSKAKPTAKRPRPTLVLAILIFLSLTTACTNPAQKTVIRFQVRSNRVEAQAPINRYSANTTTPTTVQRTTPTPISTRDAIAPTKLSPSPAVSQTATATPVPVPVGRPDRIVISSIGVDTKVVSVFPKSDRIGDQWFQNWQTASFAAGYHEGSAFLGQAGNTVISGHNNIDGSVFRYLYKLEPGEDIKIYSDGYRYDYIVVDRFILKEKDAPLAQRMQNASWIRSTIDERLTLVSCWPPDGNDYRVIVVAKPSRQLLAADTLEPQN